MRPLPFAIAIALATTTARAQEAMPVETVAKVKEATTYIVTKVDPDEDGPTASGSGFVIRTDGTTGYIVTNDHVVAGSREGKSSAARPAVRVYFRSGTKSETTAEAEVVAAAPERDLALLKVTDVANLPEPIALDARAEPFETMTVYTFGFPFGERLALGRGNPPVNVGRGQVSSVRRDDRDRLTSVLLDGALNPGNSGGPVVDAKGRLVGVAKATIRGANIGFAIAVPELLAMLDGRAGEATLAVGSLKGGAAELTVAVPLLDPLARIKSARLLHARGAARFSKAKRPDHPGPPAGPEDDGDRPARGRRDGAPQFLFGPIEGAETLPLRIDKGRATGRLMIPLTARDFVLWHQVSFVDGSGQTVLAQPGRCFLSAWRSNGLDQNVEGLTFWGEAVDPDGDCELRLEGGALVCDVPGTLHDLNIDIDRNNAPRVVQEVEGDFVATVKVTGSFQPGPVRTGPKSVPYNGGGLVAWLDEGNTVRLERGAMYRNNRVMGLLAFESREQGTRAEVHNRGGLDPREDLWLRLERHGQTVSGFFSPNGQDWEELRPIDVDWPSRLKVGVDAVNSCGDPMSVRFQSYSLRRLKDRPPAGGH
jgi:S1-C subfamily serine protease/regulation of enolase protein 1 (concanavalin A-like superfamily)